MPTNPTLTLTGLVPDPARADSDADRDARRLRRAAWRATWMDFIETVFEGAPRHPTQPDRRTGPSA